MNMINEEQVTLELSQNIWGSGVVKIFWLA